MLLLIGFGLLRKQRFDGLGYCASDGRIPLVALFLAVGRYVDLRFSMDVAMSDAVWRLGGVCPWPDPSSAELLH